MTTNGLLARRIDRIVKEAVRTSPENTLRGFGGEPAWGDALVGFASGDDPLFAFLKDDIGGFYWTPQEIFDLTFGAVSGGGASSLCGRLSVVAWVVPQTEATRKDQQRESRFPSRRWMVSRAYWSELTRDVHQTVVRELAALGLRAVAPEMSEHWRRDVSPRYGHASTWSQRHTAFVAGLGTFGLSDGLITPVGKSIRAGSVIVEAALPATPRRYTGHLDWCAFHADGSCADCVDRCPCGAITRGGHDKARCEAYMQQVVREYAQPVVGDRTGGCGLCQTGVGCESGIPVATG